MTQRSMAVPLLPLPDGQAQVAQTGSLVVCPGGARDLDSGVCLGANSPPPFLTNASFVVQGSLFIFRVPSSTTLSNFEVMVERLCGGNTTGVCGPPLIAFGKGCPEGSCNWTDVVPYGRDSNVGRDRDQFIFDALGGIRIPFETCLGGSVPPGTVAPDCLYSIGVYPVCNFGSGVFSPGNCTAPSAFRVTLSTPIGTQRVPQDGPGFGKVYTLPAHSVGTGALRRYEGYASSAYETTSVTVTASLCYGNPSLLAVYACTITGGCASPNNPSPGNADAFAVGTNAGVAQVTFTSLQDVYYVGVSAGGGGPGPSGPLDANYSLSFQHGPGPVFAASSQQPPAAAWTDATATEIVVTWSVPVILNPGVFCGVSCSFVFSPYASRNPLSQLPQAFPQRQR